MSKKIMVFILGLIGMCILTDCRFSSNKEFKSGHESAFEEFDVDYTSNEDGTYTYKENIYKYKENIYKYKIDVYSIVKRMDTFFIYFLKMV